MERTAALLAVDGWRLVNIDSTIIAQQPKLAPYLDRMGENIARALTVQPQQVAVKAKTAEGLGPVGQGQSMEALAVVLVQKN